MRCVSQAKEASRSRTTVCAAQFRCPTSVSRCLATLHQCCDLFETYALHDMLTDGFAGGRMDVSAYQGAEGASEALQSRHCKRGAVSARYSLLATCFRTQRMLAFIPDCQQYVPVTVCMRVQTAGLLIVVWLQHNFCLLGACVNLCFR